MLAEKRRLTWEECADQLALLRDKLVNERAPGSYPLAIAITKFNDHLFALEPHKRSPK